MRTILHIDMNSYFASVEQQARPSLRGRAIGVTGPSKRSIIVAASVEAKKFGVKTGTQIWEAKKMCPRIVLISADCNRYEAVTRLFLEIFISKTPLVEIFSIDEAFLELSCQQSAVSFQQAEKVALEIKNEMRAKIGRHVRCSIGIAQNKFMAKLASEAHKPDGLTVVPFGREIQFLDQFELTDACGIGRRINASLVRLGINSFKDLRQKSQIDLTLIFNSYGLRLYNMARGIDNDPIHPYFDSPAPKSISRSKTLPRDTFDKDLVNKMILSFCQNIGSELRSKNLLGGSIAVWLRYGDFTSFGQSKTIKSPTYLTREIFFHARSVLKKLPYQKPVRKIGVYIGALRPANNQLYLLDEWKKPFILDQIADSINKKSGEQVITRSSLANLNFSGRAPSYGFKKNLFD